MSMKRLLAIGLIYGLACAGWMILGTTTGVRSTTYFDRLSSRVEGLWGVDVEQSAPRFSLSSGGTTLKADLLPVKNIIDVTLDAEHRRKGLVWYPTYTVGFDGTYTLSNTGTEPLDVMAEFTFPAGIDTFENFSASLDGEDLSQDAGVKSGVNTVITIPPGGSSDFRVTYACRGMGEWRYRPGPHTGRVRNLALTAKTNFEKIDFSEGSLSPNQIESADGASTLTWDATDLLTQDAIAVVIPERLNPGPLTSRITFFAPVCLIFFFVLIGTTNIMYKVNIHPMHYLFVAAGFFAFHLLLAYMVGLMNVHVSFVVAAIVSVGLVTTYLAAALGPRFPSKIAAAGQILFLVLFSYSFFLEGSTGLTVAIGSVVTLGVLMRVTAKVNWADVFASEPRKKTPSPPQAVPLPAEG